MAIKIIKQGNLKHITYRFTCPKCECIFEADGYEAIGGEMFMFLIPFFVWISPEIKKSIKEIKDELSR